MAIALPATTATLLVPAEYPTIQLAVDAAAVGDTVAVSPGTYEGSGFRQIDFRGKDIVLRSVAGAAHTTLLGDYNSGSAIHLRNGESRASVIEGFTFEMFWASRGGGVRCDGTSPTIQDCVFLECHAESSGGGVFCEFGSPLLRDCAFIGCSCEYAGGGFCIWAGDAEVYDCRFESNRGGGSPDVGGGGIYGAQGNLRITGCTFVDNSNQSLGWGAAIHYSGPSLTASQCLFVRNWTESSRWEPSGGALSVYGRADLTACTFYGNDSYNGSAIITAGVVDLERCIIAAGLHSEAIRCIDVGVAVLTCCDVYGNAGGDWVGCLEGQLGINGNVAALPLFCNPAVDDFTLHSDSPCAPGNSGGCGLVGALPVACGVTAVESTTWGAIKAAYTR